jgi:hypothetical protein
MFVKCCMHAHCLCHCTAQGTSQDAHDILLMTKTIAYRTLAPVPLWKVLPDRQFNAATKRFDAQITGLIAQEKARLAAAGNTGTSTATGSDTDTFTDTSGVTGSCLLTQLVQYGAATEPATSAARISADKGNESSRYALTSKEVLPYCCYLYLYYQYSSMSSISVDDVMLSNAVRLKQVMHAHWPSTDTSTILLCAVLSTTAAADHWQCEDVRSSR